MLDDKKLIITNKLDEIIKELFDPTSFDLYVSRKNHLEKN